MELLNHLFPYQDFTLPLTLHKINKHYFGGEVVHLESGKHLAEYLISPIDSLFMRVESDDYEAISIFYGDVIIIEKNHLRYDGPAVVEINKGLVIREIAHSRDFQSIIRMGDVVLAEGRDFKYWGTISYVLRSEEEDFLDMVGQELIIVT